MTFILILLFLSMLFNFLNGMNNAANAIASGVYNTLFFSAMVSAIVWTPLSSHYGLPMSDLIGGLIGSSLLKTDSGGSQE